MITNIQMLAIIAESTTVWHNYVIWEFGLNLYVHPIHTLLIMKHALIYILFYSEHNMNVYSLTMQRGDIFLFEQYILPNNVVYWLEALLCIQEIWASFFGLDAGYHYWSFSRFSSAPSGICWNSNLK